MKSLQQSLFICTKERSALLGENFHEVKMIVCEDFNTNFTDDGSRMLFDFLKPKSNLVVSNDKDESTMRYETTIDAIFTKFLDKFKTRIFIYYFSYDKQIVPFLILLH